MNSLPCSKMNSATNFNAASSSASSLFPLSRLIIDLTRDSESDDERERELEEMFGSDSGSDICVSDSPGIGINAVPGCGCDHCAVAPQPVEPLMLLREEVGVYSDLESVGGINNGGGNFGGAVGGDGGGGDNGPLDVSVSCETLFSAGGGGGINIGDVASGSAGCDWEWCRLEAAPFYAGGGGGGSGSMEGGSSNCSQMEVDSGSYSGMYGYNNKEYSSCGACEDRGIVCVCSTGDSDGGSECGINNDESGSEDGSSSSDSGDDSSECSSSDSGGDSSECSSSDSDDWCAVEGSSSDSGDEGEICGAPTRDGVQCTNTVHCAWASHQHWRLLSGYECAVADVTACPHHPCVLLSSCSFCAELRSAARTRLSGTRSRPVVLPYPEWVGLHAMLE